MNSEVNKVIFFVVAIVIASIKIRTGYKRGFIRECSFMFSIVVSILSLILVLLLYSSLKGKTYGTVIVVGSALVLIGIAYKFIRLVIHLLQGISNIGIVGILDRMIGALFGVVEALIIIFFAYKLLAYLGYSIPL